MAVASILDRVEQGELALVRSPAHDLENSRYPREDRRLAAAAWLDGASIDLRSDVATLARGDCDDRLLHRARRMGDDLSIRVLGPLDFSPDEDAP